MKNRVKFDMSITPDMVGENEEQGEFRHEHNM
jgi:hypothetical protein